MNLKYAVFILMLASLISCNNSKNQEATEEIIVSKEEHRNELYQEVIMVHDEVMPKMELIINLDDRIREQMDSLLENDSASERLIMLNEMKLKLDVADKTMMNWMRGFDVEMNADEVDQNEAIQYFENELLRIEEVKKVVDQNIEEVQLALEEL